MIEPEATFISPEDDLGGAPLLRRVFEIDDRHGSVVAARLTVSALGIVEPYLNGRRVSRDLLVPGWSSYEWRVRTVEYDVRDLVETGGNALGLALANGWYRGRLTWTGGSAFYGDRLAAYARLVITYMDGHQAFVVTSANGGGWRYGASATTSNDLYDGQDIDARRDPGDWSSPSFDDVDWGSEFDEVTVDAALEPHIAPTVRAQIEIPPVEVWLSTSGRVLVDFGQNLVGWVRVKARGIAGRVLTLRHAEVLEDAELGVRPLRSAMATDRFTLSGGDDVFEPTFTFHGFRYVEVEGWDGHRLDELRDALTAVAIHSDMQRIGRFSSSNALVNRLHENAVWSMRGNFVDVPTDCPQRDERLGWTGDLAAFGSTAVFLFDAQDFLRDWLRDVALEQRHGRNGVPLVVPDVLKYINQPDLPPIDTAALWSDVAVWLPWALWQAYGDVGVLGDAFDSMVMHARRELGLLSAEDVWDEGFQFGDWLDPDAPADRPWAAKADAGVVATACAYRTCRIVADAAAVLGRGAEEIEFRTGAERIRSGFHRAYVAGERITSDCSAVYTLAIVFGLLDHEELVWAGARLAELVKLGGYRISTGFAATPFIADALTVTGHADLAYRMLLQTDCPSWLYPVTMGATTVWERWDSMLPDGAINPGEMTSFNHYALGAIADWLHRTVGGLAPLTPGYRRMLVAPVPGGDLTWAETSLFTPHGLAAVRWSVDGERLRLTVTVPPGSTAEVRLPGVPERELGSGHHALEVAFPPEVS